MALSGSTEKAQTSAVCQFCEESSEIKWKCINCDLFLCQLCNSRIHSRNQTLRDHKVISLKECGTEDASETIRKVDLQKLNCSSHDEQKCVVYCTDCEHPICSQCLVQSHQNHKLNQLEDAYKSKIGEIRDMNSKIKSDVSYFNKEEDKLQQLLIDGDKLYTETKNKILYQEKEIKEAATKHAQKLIQELDSKWKPLETDIKKELSYVTKNKNDLQDRQQHLNQAMQSHQASDIFTTSQSLDKTLPIKSEKQIKLKKTKFIPVHTAEISKSQTFGALYDVPELELVQTYQTNLRSVSKILHCKDNTAIISSAGSRTLQKVQFNNNKLQIIKDVEITVFDMAMMSNGEILISSGRLELTLYSNDDIKIFKTFPSLYTFGLHICENNDILVGLTDRNQFSIPSKDSVRKVIVFNQFGDLKLTYEFDRDNERLFTWPGRICTYNDNICVVDALNVSLDGRVIVLNKRGQKEWVYTGCDSVNSDNRKFTPREIISNNKFLVISDYNNDALHVLNEKGEIIMCRVMEDLGIEFPLSLCVDTYRMLWIGCSIGSDLNTKIHCLTMT